MTRIFFNPDHSLFALAKKYAAIVAIVAFLLFASWVTHIVHCLGTGEWGFLIAGALFFPIAMIHGFGLWFGAF